MKRVNFVTLGVKDLAKSRAFFKDLFGWTAINPQEEICFFDMGGWVLSLYPRTLLADDAHTKPEGSGFSGITLAHNPRTKLEVASILLKAEKLGAEIIKPAQDVFWGGHSGYFRDLDGHYWEVAWNPIMPTQADGTLKLS